MEVTVILSGIPRCNPEITLDNLAYYLDKLFDTNEIGTFKVRDLPMSGNKRLVALDFNSGYDAMCAQNLLDGKPYSVNGVMNVLRARVTHDPKLMPVRSLSLTFEPNGREDTGSSNNIELVQESSKLNNKMSKKKKNEKIDVKLKYLDIKKKAIATEEELLLIEREKIRRELEALSSNEDSPPKKRSRQETAQKRKQEEVESNPHDLRTKLNARKIRNTPSRSSSSEKDYRSYDRRGSRDSNRKSSNGWYNEKRTREQSHRYSSHRDSSHERDQRDCYRRSRDSCSRSKERYGYSSSDRNLSHKLSPSKFGKHRSDIRDKVSKRAIDYRPIHALFHGAYSRTSRSSEKEEPIKEIIINRKELHETIEDTKKVEIKIKMEDFKASKDEMKSKQDEAIKDIMLELGKDFSELSVKHNISDTEKSGLVKKLFETVNRRIKSLKFTNDMTVSNLIMHYRCKYSKIEDKDLVVKLFNGLIKARNDSAAVTEAEPDTSNPDDIWNALDSVLQEFNISSLTEDVKPKIEPETQETEITNITINLNPISTNKQLYQVRDGDYFINITVDRNRPKKFYITIKILLKNLSNIMKKYESYITYELFEYVMRWILEKRITNILEGKNYMTARELYDLYRNSYFPEEDENFVLQTVYEIWEGKYNDPVLSQVVTDKLPKVYSSKIKKEKDDPQSETPTSENTENIGDTITEKVVTVKTENVSEETLQPVIKTEKDIKQEINTDIRQMSNKECDIDTIMKGVENSSINVKQEVKCEKIDDDNVITEQNWNNVINKDTVSCETVKPENQPPNNDDIVVVVPKPDIIDLSDTEEMPIIKTEDKIKKEKPDEVVDLSRDDDNIVYITGTNEEEKSAIKTEETFEVKEERSTNEVVDLSLDEDIVNMTGQKEGSLPHQDTLTSIGSNTTQKVDIDVTVDKTSACKISRKAKMKKEIQTENKERKIDNEVIEIDDDITETNDIDNADFNPSRNSNFESTKTVNTNAIKSENVHENGVKVRDIDKTDIVHNVDDVSDDEKIILNAENEQNSCKDCSVKINKKIVNIAKTDVVYNIDDSDASSVDTIFLNKENEQGPNKSNTLIITDSITETSEIVTEKEELNSEKAIESVKETCAMRNCDFNDDSSETVDTIKRYLDSLTESVYNSAI